jgi:hypothetical protein
MTAVRAAASWSMAALTVIDLYCGTATGLLGFFVLRERYDVEATLHAIEASPA